MGTTSSAEPDGQAVELLVFKHNRPVILLHSSNIRNTIGDKLFSADDLWQLVHHMTSSLDVLCRVPTILKL